MNNNNVPIPTSYHVLFDGVLSKIKDYDFIKFSKEEIYSIMSDYIKPAIVRFSTCKQNLTDRDDFLQQFNVELTETEIEILINYMLISYLDSNYICVPTMLKSSL